MRFPTLKIDDPSIVDKSFNSTTVAQLGPGQIAYSNESLLDPIPVMEFQGRRVLRTPNLSNSVSKFTVEFTGVATSAANLNTLFSSEAFWTTTGQFLVILTSHRFILYRFTTGPSEFYVCEIPVEVRGKLADYAVVLDYPNWNFYVNGTSIGQTTMNHPITSAPFTFFGSIDENRKPRTGFVGDFTQLRVHNGIALTPELLYKSKSSVDRTTALSTLVDTIVPTENVDAVFVTSVINDASKILVRYSDGDFLLIPKVQGSAEGVFLTGMAFDETDSLVVSLSDGSSISVGPVGQSATANRPQPPGVGYLHDDAGTLRYLNPTTDGSVILTESGSEWLLSLPAVDTPPITHDTKYSVYERKHSSEVSQAATTAGVWYERTFTEILSFGATPLTLTAGNRFVLPAGNYYVDGYVSLILQGSCMARLVNAADTTVLLKSEVGYTTGTTRLNRRLTMRGVINLLTDTEIKTEFSSSVNSTAVTQDAVTLGIKQLTSELHFYRIA